MSIRGIIAAACVFGAAACATAPTPYAPATSASGYGYTEQRIESDRYTVGFSGNGATGAEQVRDLALLRAAEVTLENGYDWFQVVSRDTETTAGRGYGGPSVGIGVGGASGSRGSSTGVGVGISLPFGGEASGPSQSGLEILMRHGTPPTDNPDAYNARAVVSNLGGGA